MPQGGQKTERKCEETNNIKGFRCSGSSVPIVYLKCTGSSCLLLNQPSPKAAASGASHRPGGLPICLRVQSVQRANTSAARPFTKRLGTRLRHVITRKRSVLSWRLNKPSHRFTQRLMVTREEEARSIFQIHQRAIRMERLFHSTQMWTQWLDNSTSPVATTQEAAVAPESSIHQFRGPCSLAFPPGPELPGQG